MPPQPNAPPNQRSASLAAARPQSVTPPNPQKSGAGPEARPAVPTDTTILQTLLSIEEATRSIADLSSLRHFVVNETRKLNAARQIFLIEVGRADKYRVTAVSGIGTFDPSSILVDDLAKVVKAIKAERGTLAELTAFTLPAYAGETVDLKRMYPFREVLWAPFAHRNGGVFAGIACMRESIWTTPDVTTTSRLSGVYAHAWAALSPWSAKAAIADLVSRRRTAITAAIALAMLVPVPITALAPAEIVGKDREIIAAPMDGVVETIEVDPSSAVKSGQIIARMADLTWRNRRDIAAQEKAVAEARMKQASLLAFSDAKGRFELAIAQADLDLKQAELAFANEQLARASVRATRDGIAVFPDKRSLTGKPVATGERLMEIVDPGKVEVRIDLAAPDAIALGERSRAKIFLDVEPLSPRRATIFRTDHRARPSDTDVLSFRAFAHLDGVEPPPRLGLRGTAQVLGDYAPLAFVLFRRPLAATRQWLGL